MKLKINRSQDITGMLKKKIVFALSTRLELTPEEEEIIEKYKLSKRTIYERGDVGDNDYFFTSLSQLIRGGDYSREGLGDITDIEVNIIEGCRVFKVFLERVSGYGGEEVIEF